MRAAHINVKQLLIKLTLCPPTAISQAVGAEERSPFQPGVAVYGSTPNQRDLLTSYLAARSSCGTHRSTNRSPAGPQTPLQMAGLRAQSQREWP